MASSDTAPKRRRLRKLREAPSRFISRTPWLRRRYARRMVRTIDKYKDKKRPLPENLARLERQLRRVPPPKRAEMVEQMMEMSSQPTAGVSNRALRRASGRQDRQKGSKGGGLRPGTLPGQRQRTPPPR